MIPSNVIQVTELSILYNMKNIIYIILFAFVFLLIGCGNNEDEIEEVTKMDKMKLISSVFENNKFIPDKYGANFDNINPPLEISNVPKGTKSLVLIMDDPDAMKPAGKVWDHWIVWNINPGTNVIEENSVPGIQGINSGGKNSYGGPRPPDATHRYFFKIFALDTELELSSKSTKKDVENAMRSHILERTELVGLFSPK